MQVYSNELYHYGILGMKWGVRRYQNSDGSLKPAGEKRYYGKKSISKSEKRAIKKDRLKLHNQYQDARDAEVRNEYKKAYDYAEKEGLDLDDYVYRDDDGHYNSYARTAREYGIDRKTIAAVIEYSKLTDAAEAAEEAIAKKYSDKVNKELIKKYGSETVSRAMTGHASKIDIFDSDSAVTKRVKEDFNKLGENEFRRKYGTSKKTYATRVDKYGDPSKMTTWQRIKG